MQKPPTKYSVIFKAVKELAKKSKQVGQWDNIEETLKSHTVSPVTSNNTPPLKPCV